VVCFAEKLCRLRNLCGSRETYGRNRPLASGFQTLSNCKNSVRAFRDFRGGKTKKGNHDKTNRQTTPLPHTLSGVVLYVCDSGERADSVSAAVGA